MGYSLQAIVAKSDILVIEGLRPVQLPQSYSLCSFDSDYCEKWSVPFLPLTDEGSSSLPDHIQKIGLELSRRGAVAYLEAEYFGGEGTQACVVWEGGKVVQTILVHERAINVALRVLGVKCDDSDEFDAIELGRHRNIDDWSRTE